MEINRHLLDNGLTLLHYENRQTEMVALNILYKVGAKDEDPERTGFAHLFEHLMFGGSVNIPMYDEIVQNAGGENNAWTNNDYTNYYITVPKQNVETAFWLESDRMLSLDFNQKSLDVQKGVVIEEFKQRYLNKPYGDMGHIVRESAYKEHPYQWPTIGKRIEHIEDATLEDVKKFFFNFYAPNNAILSVTGNISFEKAVELTEKWFGDIERREVIRKEIHKEPKQTEERRVVVERNVPLDTIVIAYKMCDRMSDDYYVYDLISDILANGNSCRLIENLVKQKQIFTSIDSHISGSIDAGLFYISGKPNNGISLEEAEKAIEEELERLKNEPIDEYELNKVKNIFESTETFGSISYLNVATNLALFEAFSTAERYIEEVERYRNVKAEDVMRVARDTFVKNNRTILYYQSSYKSEPKNS